jgi:hypothetical protein
MDPKSDLMDNFGNPNMAHLLCRKCKWEQDDFWTEKYNPIRSLLALEEDLLSRDFEEEFYNDDLPGGRFPWRELFAKECERAANKIMGMKYRTEAEAKAAGWKCPKCGEKMV